MAHQGETLQWWLVVAVLFGVMTALLVVEAVVSGLTGTRPLGIAMCIGWALYSIRKYRKGAQAAREVGDGADGS